jgi:hypothetical protein
MLAIESPTLRLIEVPLEQPLSRLQILGIRLQDRLESRRFFRGHGPTECCRLLWWTEARCGSDIKCRDKQRNGYWMSRGRFRRSSEAA